VVGACECGNELSGPVKCGEFLGWLRNQLASEEGLCCMELKFTLEHVMKAQGGNRGIAVLFL
jgi:hypothetical protein